MNPPVPTANPPAVETNGGGTLCALGGTDKRSLTVFTYSVAVSLKSGRATTVPSMNAPSSEPPSIDDGTSGTSGSPVSTTPPSEPESGKGPFEAPDSSDSGATGPCVRPPQPSATRATTVGAISPSFIPYVWKSPDEAR